MVCLGSDKWMADNIPDRSIRLLGGLIDTGQSTQVASVCLRKALQSLALDEKAAAQSPLFLLRRGVV